MDGNLRADGAADWLRLVQAMALCGRQLRKALAELAAPQGLSDTDCLILWACCEAPPEGQGQHELVSLLGVSPAQLSGLVEQLSAQGWIVGRRPAHDRRRQYWRLTAAGQTLVSELLAGIDRWLADCQPQFALADQRTLQRQVTTLGASVVIPHRAKEAA